MELLDIAKITTVLMVVFTLIFQYIPGLRVKWASVKSEYKKAIVLGLYLMFGAAVAFGGCLPEVLKVFPQLLCVDAPIFLNFVFGVLVAIGAGQGIFSLMPELNDVKEVKAMREESLVR